LSESNWKNAEKLTDYVIMGEGALPIAIQARKEGFKGLILPKENACEAAMVTICMFMALDTSMK
jgi:magnesium chelatase family protein